MLKKRNYVIVGITPKMEEKWRRELGEDIQFIADNKTGKIQAKMLLTRFQALVIRLGMIKYNLTHPCVLKLEKYKGKRYRA